MEQWDLPYYMAKAKELKFANSGGSGGGGYDRGAPEVAAYFPLDRCVHGLALLCRQLFDVEVTLEDAPPEETWCGGGGVRLAGIGLGGPAESSRDSSSKRGKGDGGRIGSLVRSFSGGSTVRVQKMSLRHPTEGPLGYIYLDLQPREHKYGHAAHFTVRCGCVTADDIIGDMQGEGRDEEEVESGGGNSGPLVVYDGYQLPVVALVMNFGAPNAASFASPHYEPRECLLGHTEVETLFHEFGHALHSLLSRTRFQHLSGTRTAADFVETPSQLLEHFVWDLRSLGAFSRHYATGEPLPAAMLEEMATSKHQHAALDTLHQVLLSLYDLELFGEATAAKVRESHFRHLERLEEEKHGLVRANSGKLEAIGKDEGGGASIVASLAHDLHEEVMPTCMPAPRGTHWVARFGHLTSYGATYYGYLYDKVSSIQPTGNYEWWGRQKIMTEFPPKAASPPVLNHLT